MDFPRFPRFPLVLLLAIGLMAANTAASSAQNIPRPNNKPANESVEPEEPQDKSASKSLAAEPCYLPKPLCGDRPDYGAYWNDKGNNEKKSLLHGFDVGMNAAWQASYLEGEEAGAIRASIFDRRISTAETYAGKDIEQMVKYFDRLYADPKNAYIDWMYSWMLASLHYQELNISDGRDNDENYLVSFLQRYGELPGWIRVVDIKDVDLLEVEVLVPEPFRLTVKLRGISTKNGAGKEMTDAQRDRAIKFMRGLAATRGYPFKDCSCTEMVRPQLFYGSSLFTSNGTLEAIMRINEKDFCLTKGEVSAAALDPDSDQKSMVLNDVLLRLGLAYMDEGVLAYEESDRFQEASDYAVSKGNNLYGASRPTLAERIIRQGPKIVNQNCLP